MPSLGKDLAAIRNEKELSIEDVQQATKVPPNILQSIEDDSIFTELQENATYIRSYVRSYAKAVGVKEEDIVEALNREEAGNYEGNLRETPNSDEKFSEEKKAKDNPESKNGDMLEEHTPKFSFDQNEPDSPKKEIDTSKSAYTPHSVSTIDWADVGRKAKPAQSRSRIWYGLIVIVVIVLALAAIFLFYNYYNSDPAEEPVPGNKSAMLEPEAPSDSLRESLITKNDGSIATTGTTRGEQGSLADTLSIALYAANGRLDPVRVYTDILGRRNPYWIQQGDTLQLNFVNTVRIRAANQYNRLQLLVNGHVIPDFYRQYYNSESQMIELDRSIFEDDPKWRTPANN